jgi:hypothetical protein
MTLSYYQAMVVVEMSKKGASTSPRTLLRALGAIANYHGANVLIESGEEVQMNLNLMSEQLDDLMARRPVVVTRERPFSDRSDIIYQSVEVLSKK